MAALPYSPNMATLAALRVVGWCGFVMVPAQRRLTPSRHKYWV
jgi:hypothetical protein